MSSKLQRRKPLLMTVSGGGEPPDKRRRTEVPPSGAPGRESSEFPVPVVTDDDWGSDDNLDQLTEDDLKKIDFVESQFSASTPTAHNATATAAPTDRTFSMLNKNDIKTHIYPKIQTNVPFFKTEQRSQPRVGTRKKPVQKPADTSTKNSESIKNFCVENGKTTLDFDYGKSESTRMSEMKKENEALKEEAKSHYGEITILRQQLKEMDSKIFKLKQSAEEAREQQAREDRLKCQELLRKLDKIQAESDFKDQELQEHLAMMKSRERLKSEPADVSASNTPSRSPKISKRPKSPSASNGFPTPDSFIGKRPSPVKSVSPVKVKVETSHSHCQTDPIALDTTRTKPKNNVKRTKIGSDYIGITGAVLVSKLQNETESGVYSFLDTFRKLRNSDVNDLELCHAAQSGISRLLAGKPMIRNVKTGFCDLEDSVVILPVIGRCVTLYNEFLLDDEVKAPSDGSIECYNQALDILIRLMSYSTNVRDTILVLTDEGATSDQKASKASQSRNRKENDFNKNSSVKTSSLIPSLLSLLQKVMKLNDDHSRSTTQKIVDVFGGLSSHASKQQLLSFQGLVQSSVLSDMLTPDRLTPGLLVSLTRLLTHLSHCHQLVHALCRRSEHCPFLCLYTAVQSSSSREHQVALCDELVALVAAVMTGYKWDMGVLFDNKCFCVDELPKAVVISMERLLRQTMSGGTVRSPDCGSESDSGADVAERRLGVLRKGLLLVYDLSVRGMTLDHYTEVDVEYTRFINEMKRILSTLPDVQENENMALNYLWDFDDDLSPDENSNNMDCD